MRPAESFRSECTNEARGVIEGVLSGIAHDCLVVLVPNSDRGPVDRHEIEAQTVEQFCRLAGRSAVTVHQRDPGVAAAFKAAGMEELIDDAGLVRAGKGEAMLRRSASRGTPSRSCAAAGCSSAGGAAAPRSPTGG
jgi:hypothetical protein